MNITNFNKARALVSKRDKLLDDISHVKEGRMSVDVGGRTQDDEIRNAASTSVLSVLNGRLQDVNRDLTALGVVL